MNLFFLIDHMMFILIYYLHLQGTPNISNVMNK